MITPEVAMARMNPEALASLEEQIDRILQANDWRSGYCTVTTPLGADPLIVQYRRAGWEVELESNSLTTVREWVFRPGPKADERC